MKLKIQIIWLKMCDGKNGEKEEKERKGRKKEI
jgi:hypothetical protein